MDEPRHWWRDVVPKDWRVFADRDDISRDKFTAILAALEELSTRGPMSTLSEILTHLRVVGYFDPLTEPELRRALDDLAGDELCTTFRDYAAPLRSYQEMLGRQEGWALTPEADMSWRPSAAPSLTRIARCSCRPDCWTALSTPSAGCSPILPMTAGCCQPILTMSAPGSRSCSE